MTNIKPVGNRTPRRGRKLRRDIHLDTESARALRTLLTFRRGFTPDLDEDQLVAGLINAAWEEIDAAIMAEADGAGDWDGKTVL